MMKGIKQLFLVCMCISTLISCDIFHEDKTPEPVELKLETTQLFTLSQSPAVVNIANAVQSDAPLKFKIKNDPLDGDVSFIAGDKFLKYNPDLAVEKGNDQFDLEIFDQSNRLLASGKFQVNILKEEEITPDLQVAFSDHYEIRKGEFLEVNLLDNDAIGDIPYTGDRAIDMTSVQNDESVLVSIFSENEEEKVILSYSAPKDFTGRVEFIYELCYGWSDVCPDGNLRSPACPYPQVCDNYFTALVSIDVVE